MARYSVTVTSGKSAVITARNEFHARQRVEARGLKVESIRLVTGTPR